MKCKIHAAFAVSAIYMVTKELDPWVISGAILGSYLPDCDIKSSFAGKLIPLHRWFNHREQTHSIYMGIGFSSLATLIHPYIGAGCIFGYLLHLVADRTTYMGIKKGLPFIFWPIKIKGH